MNKWKDTATFYVALILFFGSGAVSLVYQTLWVSWWVHVFGGSAYAISTVLAAFMAGLGLGAWLLGRYADRNFDRLVGYGLLEIGIGLYALCLNGIKVWIIRIPPFIEMVEPLYAKIYNHDPDAKGLLIAVRFVMSFLILLPITTMMGATLPMLSKHLVGKLSSVGSRVGSLYSWNTFGAVAGTLLAGFFFIEHWGRTRTNLNMAAANFIIGAAALLWSVLAADDEPAKPADKPATPPEPEPVDTSAAPAELSPFWVYVMLGTFAVSGGIAMIYEVAWSRLTGLILGSSTYSFTVMLSTFLIGIASGSSWAGRKLTGARCNLTTFALIQLGIGASTGLIVYLAEYLPVVFLFLAPFRDMVNPDTDYLVLNYIHSQISGLFICFLMMIVPALLLGACFPVVVQIYSRNVSHLGRSIGVVYGCNTAGAIVGSVAGGFLMLPLLGLYGTMIAACVANLALSAVLAVGGILGTKPAGSAQTENEPHGLTGPRGATAALGVSLAAAVLLALAQPWDPLVMNFGVFQYGSKTHRDVVFPPDRKPWEIHKGLADLKQMLANNYALLYARDGINSTVTVMGEPDTAVNLVLDQAEKWTPTQLAPIREAAKERLSERIGKAIKEARERNEEGVEDELKRQLDSGMLAIDGASVRDLAGQNLIYVVLTNLRTTGVMLEVPDGKLHPYEGEELEATCQVRSHGHKVLATDTVRGSRHALVKAGTGDKVGGRHLRNNGKVDASDHGDMATQLMLGYVPMFAHPAPESVCIIGLGSGTTAGAVEQFKTPVAGFKPPKEIHCVELEPAIREAALKNFSHRHRDFTKDARFRLFEQDGRNHLALFEHDYDLIISEPSNPWIAGVANLFTREFYKVSKKRLAAREGILCQWLQLYAMEWSDYLMVVRTMRSEFKHVYVFRVDPGDTGDTMVLASDREIVFSPRRMQAVINHPDHGDLRTDLGRYLFTDAFTLLHAVFLLGDKDVDAMLRLWGERSVRERSDRWVRENTDDKPLLEYSAPRALNTVNNNGVIVNHLWTMRTRKTGPGPLRSIATDWPALDDAQGAFDGCDKERLAADLHRMARRYLGESQVAWAEDAAQDHLTVRPDSAVAMFTMGAILERNSARNAPWKAKDWYAKTVGGRFDKWFLNPPDSHIATFAERFKIAQDMTERLPEWAPAYFVYGDMLAAKATDVEDMTLADASWRRARDLMFEGSPGAMPDPDDKVTTNRAAEHLLAMIVGEPVSEGPASLVALGRLSALAGKPPAP